MRLPHATDSADAPFSPSLAAADYEAGGTVGSLHETISRRLSQDAVWQATPQATPSLAERTISGFSRAMGPILLIAGYYLVARLFF